MRWEPALHVAVLLAALLACKAPKEERKAPPVSVSAVDFTRDYMTMDRAAANKKWADKDIRVTGIAYITMVCQEKPEDDVQCLMLEGYDRPGALTWLRTWLAPQAKKTIHVGSSVTLQCHVPEDGADVAEIVSVRDCTVLSTGAASNKAPRTPPPVGPARPPPRKK